MTTTTTTEDHDEPVIILNPTFPLGHVCSTPRVRELLTGGDITRLLNRHAHRDWGECCEHDRKANEDALKAGGRIVSVYRSTDGLKVWVITEADRSATTVLLPNEY